MANYPETAQSPEESNADSTQNNNPQTTSSSEAEDSNGGRRRFDGLLWGLLILLLVICGGLVLLVLADRYYTPATAEDDSSRAVFGQDASAENIDGNGESELLQILYRVPVAVQSFHPESVSRVELWAKHQSEAELSLKRADPPDEDGQLLQLWTPQERGQYTVQLLAFDGQNNQTLVAEREIVVVDSAAVRVPSPDDPPIEQKKVDDTTDVQQMAFVAEPQAAGFAPPDPPATPTPSIQCNDPSVAGASVSVQVRNQNNELVVLSASGSYLIQEDEYLTFLVSPDVSVEDIQVTIYPPQIQPPGTDVQIIPEPIPVVDVEPNEPFVFSAKTTGVHLVRVEATRNGCTKVVGDYSVDVQGSITGPAGAPPTPTPTPTPFFPPPPPAPGVPPGPTQAELPELMPPTCDAAEYVGVYIPPDFSQRVLITEPDMIPAKTVGGTLVTRAWSIQNIGTCTWGPGYELAFYGGRSMGSGGVAFESFFPNEPARRNIIVNGEQLIAPEGKPNEKANLELALVAPVTPGIHQSYWRMRNPQGVYFGPIVGVTLEVVRDCEFGYYGAPYINKFEILGVGNVYQPENPVDVDATQGQPVTLDWSIINAQSYDIVVKSPTGSTQNLSTGNTTDRASFVPTQLGDYTVTLYADNSPCTAVAIVNVNVLPPEDSEDFFVLTVANLASPQGTIGIAWERGIADADEYKLIAQRYEQHKDEDDCSFAWESGILPTYNCEKTWGAWKPSSGSSVLPDDLIGVQGQGLPAEVTGGPSEIQSASITIVSNGQQQTVNQGEQTSAQKTIGGPANSEASANLTNLVWGLCPTGYDPNNPNNTVQYGIKYRMAALKNGELLESHPFSVSVDKMCGPVSESLKTELIIEDAASSGGTEFNPQ